MACRLSTRVVLEGICVTELLELRIASVVSGGCGVGLGTYNGELRFLLFGFIFKRPWLNTNSLRPCLPFSDHLFEFLGMLLGKIV